MYSTFFKKSLFVLWLLVVSKDDLKSRVIRSFISVHWPGVHKRTEANVSRVQGFTWNLAQCYLLFLGMTILHHSFSSLLFCCLLCLHPTSTHKTTKGVCWWLFPFLKCYLNSCPPLLNISSNEIHQNNHPYGLGLLWMSLYIRAQLWSQYIWHHFVRKFQ